MSEKATESMTVEDLERLVLWMEHPDGRPFWRFIQDERDLFNERSEAAIGENAISDILNRERNISACLAMKSVLKLHADIKESFEIAKSKK